MNNSERFLKAISDIIENGILSSKDAKKEILTNLKFQKENLLEKLEVVSREEFEVLKNIVQKQGKELKALKKSYTKYLHSRQMGYPSNSFQNKKLF